MELSNQTDLTARLFSGALDEKVNAAWVVARRTYRLNSRGDAIEPAPADQQWPIFVEPLETEFGVFPADDYPFRSKAEAIVVATARSRQRVAYLEPRLQVGRFTDRILVFGNRRWVKRGDQLLPSDPEPFTEMDLGLKSAFGGQGQYADQPVPHPLNPVGKGFYVSAAEAEGRALPNVECPEAPIRRWNDQPPIATWAVVPNGPLWQMAAWVAAWRKNAAVPLPPKDKQDEARFEQEAAAQAKRAFPTAAPPRLLLEAIGPGDAVSLDLGADKIQFLIPAPAPSMHVSVGARRFTPTVRPVAVWIFVPRRLVVVTWLARYRYGLRPRERREALLMPS
jgi:hypothetical protein